VDTVVLIVAVVVGVGGWLYIHRALRRQRRADASKDTKETG
jgi:hypothetical protein